MWHVVVLLARVLRRELWLAGRRLARDGVGADCSRVILALSRSLRVSLEVDRLVPPWARRRFGDSSRDVLGPGIDHMWKKPLQC